MWYDEMDPNYDISSEWNASVCKSLNFTCIRDVIAFKVFYAILLQSIRVYEPRYVNCFGCVTYQLGFSNTHFPTKSTHQMAISFKSTQPILFRSM